MESIHKNIVDNAVPPLKAIAETDGNHKLVVFASWLIIGLLVGSLTTTLISNTIKLRKHLAQQKECKENEDASK